MGYHVADKMSTMYIYGKDNVSAGLRELDEVINLIRTDQFRPDAPRAVTFPDKAEGEIPECQAEQAESDFASSTEDSADESSPDHEAVEEAQEKVVGKFDSGLDVAKLPKGAVYFRHHLSRTIHAVEDESGARFACGRRVDKGFFQLPTRPVTMIPICRQCFARYTKP